jgi:hypothetical protein
VPLCTHSLPPEHLNLQMCPLWVPWVSSKVVHSSAYAGQKHGVRGAQWCFPTLPVMTPHALLCLQVVRAGAGPPACSDPVTCPPPQCLWGGMCDGQPAHSFPDRPPVWDVPHHWGEGCELPAADGSSGTGEVHVPGLPNTPTHVQYSTRNYLKIWCGCMVESLLTFRTSLPPTHHAC